jgi:hypothetical protein
MSINLNFLEALTSKSFLSLLLITGVLAMWKVIDIVSWLFLNVSIQGI